MNRREHIIFWGLVLVLLGFLTKTYLPGFDTPFVFDDQHAISDNVQVQSLSNFSKFFTDPRVISILPNNQVYRPITALSIALDCYFGDGPNSRIFHRNMYVVFCLQLLTMFFLVRIILKKSLFLETEYFRNVAALLITAFYGYNTCLAETLNYAAARSDSYSTFFAVLTVTLFAAGGWTRKYHVYLLPLALGALTKETGVTVPALLFAYEFLFSGESQLWPRLRKAFFATLPSIVVIAAYVVLYFWISIAAPPPGTTSLSYFVTQIYVTAHYFLMFFFPVQLTADSDVRVFNDYFNDRVLLGGVLHIVLITLFARGLFNQKLAPLSFGIIWFYAALSTTSSILPIADVQNDHRMFYPFVGLSISCGWLLLLAYKSAQSFIGQTFANVSLIIFSICYFSGHAYGITQRIQVWSSRESLWFDVVAKSPNNPRGLMNYGIQLMNRGELKGARDYFDRAGRIWPRYSYLHLNLGILNSKENKDVEAEQEFKFAIKTNPANPVLYLYYADWLKKKKRFKEALINVDNVLFLSPGYKDAIQLRKDIIFLTETIKQ